MNNTSLLFQLATLAAHSVSAEKGFRQKEVRFYTELFSNWIELGGIGITHAVHNTQIMRLMNNLVADGQAKIISKKSSIIYRLTRSGLFNILSKLTLRSYLNEKNMCMLVSYFLVSYKGQIQSEIANSSYELSKAHKLEMQQTLDINAFISRQLQFIDNEIVRMKERISAANAIYAIAKEHIAKKSDFSECIKEVSKEYPYELNSHKPLEKLLLNLPPNIVKWELSDGCKFKTKTIFEPILNDLIEFKNQLIAVQNGVVQ